MSKFTYDDIVRVVQGADPKLRPGSKAWIVGVFIDRPRGSYFDGFPEGVIYTIEYEDGGAMDVHESHLERIG